MAFGIFSLVIGISALVLVIYHWDLIDQAFVSFLEKVIGG